MKKMKNKTIELFYIGDKYYSKSGTHMSSIYVIGSHERFDWGFVQVELAKGNSVYIRPATDEEIAWANIKLSEHILG